MTYLSSHQQLRDHRIYSDNRVQALVHYSFSRGLLRLISYTGYEAFDPANFMANCTLLADGMASDTR